MLFFPEIRLQRICQSLIRFVVRDLKEKIEEGKEENSYLYLFFHASNKDKNESALYKEAKIIFSRKEEDQKFLKVYPIFDRRRATLPTIHIVIPQDSDNIKFLGDIEGDFCQETNSEILQRGFATQFELIVTSDNVLEVLIINYVLRGLLLSSIPQLQEIGFINPQFSTQDLNSNSDIMPANVYMKGILMNANYIESVPQINTEAKAIKDILFNIKEIIY